MSFNRAGALPAGPTATTLLVRVAGVGSILVVVVSLMAIMVGIAQLSGMNGERYTATAVDCQEREVTSTLPGVPPTLTVASCDVVYPATVQPRSITVEPGKYHAGDHIELWARGEIVTIAWPLWTSYALIVGGAIAVLLALLVQVRIARRRRRSEDWKMLP